MAGLRLKKCPFCGVKLKNKYPTVSEFDPGRWEVSHFCAHSRRSDLGVVIAVYGSTKEEAIRRWNARATN